MEEDRPTSSRHPTAQRSAPMGGCRSPICVSVEGNQAQSCQGSDAGLNRAVSGRATAQVRAMDIYVHIARMQAVRSVMVTNDSRMRDRVGPSGRNLMRSAALSALTLHGWMPDDYTIFVLMTDFISKRRQRGTLAVQMSWLLHEPAAVEPCAIFVSRRGPACAYARHGCERAYALCNHREGCGGMAPSSWQAVHDTRDSRSRTRLPCLGWQDCALCCIPRRNAVLYSRERLAKVAAPLHCTKTPWMTPVHSWTWHQLHVTGEDHVLAVIV